MMSFERGFTSVELPAMNKGKRSAFTLVELLVVIGIIGVLVALLLPSLVGARRAAYLTKCASNLRQIGIATHNYANDNKGSLPLRFRWDTGNKNAFPFWLYIAKDGGVTYPPVENAYQIGALYARGYMKNADACYCPVATDDFNIDTFPKPWLSDSNTLYRSSYYYNPHMRVITMTSDGGPKSDPAWMKITKYPREKCLAVEGLNANAGSLANNNTTLSIAHRDNKGNAFFNLLFPDGSVRSVNGNVTVKEMTNDPTRYSSYTYDSNHSAGDWTNFDDYRDILETVAAGRDPHAPRGTGLLSRAHPLVGRIVHTAGETGNDL
jgi:prepilin-type N-terminal cleavage/methylation domain-containing protein